MRGYPKITSKLWKKRMPSSKLNTYTLLLINNDNIGCINDIWNTSNHLLRIMNTHLDEFVHKSNHLQSKVLDAITAQGTVNSATTKWWAILGKHSAVVFSRNLGSVFLLKLCACSNAKKRISIFPVPKSLATEYFLFVKSLLFLTLVLVVCLWSLGSLKLALEELKTFVFLNWLNWFKSFFVVVWRQWIWVLYIQILPEFTSVSVNL